MLEGVCVFYCTFCPVMSNIVSCSSWCTCLEMWSSINSSLQQLCSNFIWSPTWERANERHFLKHSGQYQEKKHSKEYLQITAPDTVYTSIQDKAWRLTAVCCNKTSTVFLFIALSDSHSVLSKKTTFSNVLPFGSAVWKTCSRSGLAYLGSDTTPPADDLLSEKFQAAQSCTTLMVSKADHHNAFWTNQHMESLQCSKKNCYIIINSC